MNKVLDFIFRLVDIYKEMTGGVGTSEKKKEKKPVKTAKTVSPIKGGNTLTVTGAYPKYTNMNNHRGVDFGCNKNKEFTAIAGGLVTGVFKGKYRGPTASYVKIKYGNVEVYWKHCSPKVKKGDTVQAGDIIGTCDNTGPWAGYHLHFECRRDNKPIEPLTILKKYQPGLKYKLQKGEWNGYTLREVFEEFNKKGLAIIDNS